MTRRVMLICLIYVLVYAIVALVAIELDSIMSDFFTLMMQTEPNLAGEISTASTLWSVPFAVIIPYYVLMIMLPILLMMLTYRSISGEIDDRTMPDLLMSAQKSTIILSKTASAAILSGLLTFLLLLVNSAYIYVRLEQNYAMATVLLFIYFFFYSWSWITVFLLVSIISRSSQQSLLLCFSVLLALVMIDLIPSLSFFSLFHYLGFAGPMSFIARPIDPLPLIYAIFGFLIYSAAMLGAGFFLMMRREV